MALCVIVFMNKDTTSSLGEIIAVYTFATFRVMPSFVKFTMILQNITHAQPSIEVVEKHYLNKQDEITRNIKKMDEMLIKIKNKDFPTFNKLEISLDEFKYDQDVILKKS